MNRNKWVWMPHAAHFICDYDCRFHLATYLGNGYLVSTVGEYLPDSRVREIKARSAGVTIEGRGDEWDANYFKRFGFEDIGYGRKYETYVFKAGPVEKDNCGCRFRPIDWGDLDSLPANDPKTATGNHYALCDKWAKK